MDIKSVFAQSSGVGFGLFQSSNNDANRQVDLTDLAQNANFTFAKPTAVNRVHTNLAEGGAPDMSAARASAMQVSASYMAMNDQAMAAVETAMTHVCGAELGGQIMGQLRPSGGSSIVQAAATILDPTAAIGTAYAVYSELSRQADRIGDQDVLERLEQARQAIADAHEAKQNGEKPAIKVPESLDFSKITAKQLKDFVMRDPMQDPVMQEVQDALETCNQIENDVQVYEEREHEVVTADKVASAIERGDTAQIAEYGDDQLEVLETFTHDQAEKIELKPANEVKMYSDSLADMNGIHCENPDQTMSVQADLKQQIAMASTGVAVAAQNLESQARDMSVRFQTGAMR